MPTKPTHYFLCIALFLLFVSCSKDKDTTVKMVDTNIEEEISMDQNLHFIFDKPLVGDSLFNYWDSVEYVKFSPEIKGAFRWNSENILVFSPNAPFPPATSFEATLTSKITDPSKLSLGGEKTFVFRTPLLEFRSFNALWSADENNNTLIHMNLRFNYPIDPEEVMKKVSVNVDGASQQATFKRAITESEFQFYLPGISVDDKSFKIDVTVDEGIKPLSGNMATTEAIKRSLNLPSPYNVSVEDITPQHNGVDGTLTVDISQETTDDAKNFVAISPRVSFDVEVTESGLTIKSDDFDPRKRYEVTIKQGLKGKYGGTLKSDFKKEVSFGELRPEIAFEDKRSIYLSAKGAKNIKVKIINVTEVKVQIAKLYENNIQAFQNQDNYYYDYYDYDDRSVGNYGDVIWEKKYLSADLPKKGGHRVLTLDIEDQVRDYEGIYAIKVVSDERYWLKDFKLVSISDIGLVAKDGKSEITVFANSIKTATPQEGVEVSFIGRNNQLVGSATTDANGIAVFQKPTEKPSGFQIAMITAASQGDFNYMQFSGTSVNTSQFDIGGARENLSGFDIFLYGDRDIYRPGETVYLSGIVRDQNWNVPESIPLKLEVYTPDGRRMKVIRKTLNEFGSFETSLQLSDAAATGSYSVQAYTTSGVYLASTSIKVEEFVPDRIKVAVDISNTDIDIDESTDISLTATNFFGPPAANRNYEVAINASRKSFYSRDFSEYNFYSNLPNSSRFDREFMDGKTDANGQASVEYKLGSEYEDMGLVQADVFTTVFDETGRPVNRKNTITISTQDAYFGVATEQYYTATNSQFDYRIVALDKNGQVLNGVPARVKLIKHEYKTVLSRSGQYYRYRSEKVEKEIEDKQVTIGGKDTEFNFIPELSGRYEIRVSAPGVRSYVGRNFYAYGWGATNNSSFEVNPEGEIDIQFDKDSYNVGETANVILKSPFSGKVLVTLETDKILKSFYVDAENRAASFTVDIEEAYVPNIYLTATLFKPHEESELPLTIAHGAAPMLVENPDNQLPLAIEATEKSRSNTKQTIKIKSAANTPVTVAVVDEGILQLTSYKTPNPYKHFYRKRALGVKSYDIYPYLFPEINISSGLAGGDGSLDGELAKRVNPLTNKRVKLVAFWSGQLVTDGSGEAEYEIDIPQFSGDLRIMAVAHNGKAFAGTSENMKVADPLVISTALPRFFSPGDTVTVPVVMTNTTEQTASCQTKISVSGPLTIVGGTSQGVNVGAGSEGRAVYQIVADKAIGQSNVTVEVNALGESFKNSTDITVRPASPLQKVSGSGTVNGGAKKQLTLAEDQFLKESIRRQLVVSNTPMIEFAKDLDYLVRYPHGCVEQTVSAVFPQLYYQELTRSLMKAEDPNKVYNSNTFVNAAINKLQRMQLYDGSLTYWPGGGYASWWGSVYAAHFLHEARKAGFDVDEDFFSKLQGYLITQLKSRSTFYYYFNSTRRKIANKEIPYSLYVLALSGNAQRSTMNYYKGRRSELSLDGKYMLAAAYKLIGDDKSYREILPAEFAGEKSKRSFGGSFYSYIRDEAISLNTLMDVDANNPQVPVMAKHLSTALKGRRYLNTQERVFSFLALGKLATNNAGNNVTAKVRSNGKQVGSFNGKTLTLTSSELTDGNVEIETSGTGNLYYFWNTEGINADGSYREEDSNLKVRRTFYNRNGQQIYGNRFKQNDLVVVMLTISSSNGEDVENVAMTDILPAGFEIENPRISEVPGTEWVTGASRPDYADIRDDRITFFLNTGRYERKYFYVIRAVSKGTFQLGPIGADAMYDGEYHSYSGGGTIVVE